MVEELLQLFVREVDAKLLESVELESHGTVKVRRIKSLERTMSYVARSSRGYCTKDFSVRPVSSRTA